MPFGLPSKTSFYHSQSSIPLKTRTASLSLADFSKSVITPFYYNPLLFNGHLQTFWTVTKFSDNFPIHYSRQLITNPNDQGQFAVDFVVDDGGPAAEDLPPRTRYMTEEEKAALASDDEKPMIVALHGLSGGSYELYLRAVLAPLVASETGFAACVVTARGCSLSKITTGQLFNARFTDDLRETVKYLKKIFPNRPLFAIGFSMGANILANFTGEEGEGCPFKAVALCSNPWNLEVANNALQRRFLGSMIYSSAMGRSLRNLFELHVDVFSADPRIDVDLVRRGRHLFEFDRDLTARVFNYPTVGTYYRDASSVKNLLNFRVPTFIVHASDDPIAVDEAVPYDEVKANPFCFMVTTSVGGHLSWFEVGGGRWFAKVIAEFFTKFANEVVEVNPTQDTSTQ